MEDTDSDTVRLTRRGLVIGGLAAAGLAATGSAAFAGPRRLTQSGLRLATPAPADPGLGDPPGYRVPTYQTAVPGESIEALRVDQPVAPGIVRTTFDTFGRTGWTRVHVLSADLSTPWVGVDLLETKFR